MKKKDLEKRRSHIYVSDFMDKNRENLKKGNINGIKKADLANAILDLESDINEFYDNIIEYMFSTILSFKYHWNDFDNMLYEDLRRFKECMAMLRYGTFWYSHSYRLTKKLIKEKFIELQHHMSGHMGNKNNASEEITEEFFFENLLNEEYHIRNFITWHKNNEIFMNFIREVYPEYSYMIQEILSIPDKLGELHHVAYIYLDGITQLEMAIKANDDINDPCFYIVDTDRTTIIHKVGLFENTYGENLTLKERVLLTHFIDVSFKDADKESSYYWSTIFVKMKDLWVSLNVKEEDKSKYDNMIAPSYII